MPYVLSMTATFSSDFKRSNSYVQTMCTFELSLQAVLEESAEITWLKKPLNLT